MTFYLGREYHNYEKKFQDIKKYIQENFPGELDRNSRAEIFRWILDRMNSYVKEKNHE